MNDIIALIFSVFTGGLSGAALTVFSEMLSFFISMDKLNKILNDINQAFSRNLSGTYSIADVNLELKPDMKIQGLEYLQYVRVKYSAPFHPLAFLYFLHDSALANFNSGYISEDEYNKIKQFIALLLPVFWNVGGNNNYQIPVRIFTPDRILVKCSKGKYCRQAIKRCNPTAAVGSIYNAMINVLLKLSDFAHFRNHLNASQVENITCEQYREYSKVWAKIPVSGYLDASLSIKANSDEESVWVALALISFINVLIRERKIIARSDIFTFYKVYKELNMISHIEPIGHNEDGDDNREPSNPTPSKPKRKKSDITGIFAGLLLLLSILEVILNE